MRTAEDHVTVAIVIASIGVFTVDARALLDDALARRGEKEFMPLFEK